MPKNIGTKKFIIRMNRATAVRGTTDPRPRHYVYYQWGRIWECDENGDQIGNGHPFSNLGDMQSWISVKMRSLIREDLRRRGRW